MSAVLDVLAEIGDLAVETQPQKVKRRSRDFYWYSPILKGQLDHVTADAVVTPRSEAEIVRVVAACHRQRVPLTVRGGGTGNYGQAMPLQGGIVLDLSELTAVKAIGHGRVRAEAGIRLAELDAATIADSRQELRLHPSTHKTGTVGGYVAGGSSGIGSITWGLLRDRGNILMTRVVTMEAEPRILELRGADVQKVNHAYGTNGIITELELPLAPAYRWAEALVAFPDFATAARCADALAHEDAILKKLVSVIAAPVAPRLPICRAGRAGRERGDCDGGGFRRGRAARRAACLAGKNCVPGLTSTSWRRSQQPLFEYTWNHTTLHALKHDRTITYLQTLFPAPHHLEKVAEMAAEFGDEVPLHLEFVRFGGEIACFGLQLVRYSSDERLRAIIEHHERHGCPIFNPHEFTLEGGGMKKVDHVQLAFKREADPLGLLNPGKMIGWDDPAYGESHDHRFLYDPQ